MLAKQGSNGAEWIVEKFTKTWPYSSTYVMFQHWMSRSATLRTNHCPNTLPQTLNLMIMSVYAMRDTPTSGISMRATVCEYTDKAAQYHHLVQGQRTYESYEAQTGNARQLFTTYQTTNADTDTSTCQEFQPERNKTSIDH